MRLSDLQPLLVRHRFVLVSFSIPLLIRLIPEIIAGPFPIGWDTIAAYVPAMRDWAAGNTAAQFDPALGGWLIYVLFGSLYSATKVDPILILKVVAPVLYGMLSIGEYFFSRRMMGWDSSRSAFLVLVASTYFVSLRLSWDLFRNMLGLVLMLPSLVVWKNAGSTRQFGFLAFLMLLVVAAHPLVGVLFCSIVLSHALISRQGNWKRALAALPATAWCGVTLLGFSSQGATVLANGNQVTNPLGTLAYPVYIFLPLIPFALLGLTRLHSTLLNAWIVVCGLGVLASITPLAVSIQLVEPERWSFMMFLPLVVFAIEGFIRLRDETVVTRNLGRALGIGWLLLLVILGSTYVGLQAQTAFPYYSNFQPTSMLQSTIPVQYSQAMINNFLWLSGNTTGRAIIIAPNAEYGWAREYYTGNLTILGFSPGVSIQSMLQTALSKGTSSIYIVWWSINEGWGNPKDLPQGFEIVHTDGPFGVYIFSG